MQKQNAQKGLKKRTKQLQTSKIMKLVRKKYVGCIALHTSPEIYKECLEEYNDSNENYEKYSLIPYNALRQKQYENELELENTQRAGVFKLSENAKISYLPKGIWQYIDSHPEKFDSYLWKVKTESEYLHAIKKAMRHEKNLHEHEKMRERLYDYITEEKEY